jgi:hypothetical protein
MTSRSVPLLLLAAALAGCGGQRVPAASRHLPASVAAPPSDASLLRVSRAGGNAELLRASTLAPKEWAISGGLPAISRLLGASIEQQTVYAADANGRLVAMDLVARRSRIIPTTARQLIALPDGTLLGVDSSRHPVRISGGTITTFKAVVERGSTLSRGPGDAILVAGGRPAVLQVLNEKGELGRFPIPAGHVATTWAGDLVAVTTDTGITLIDPAAKPAPVSRKGARGRPGMVSVRIRGTPVVATFSPSGHRLYVGLKKGGLVMVDRYSHQQLQELPLPGAPDGLRVDRTGRWLLVHGEVGDSLWVVDLSRGAIAASRAAPWSEDLPQVIDGHILLVRNHADLMAIDVDGATPPERGVLVGGASDLYYMLPWVPRGTQVALAPPKDTSHAAPAQVTPPAGGDSGSTAATPPASAISPKDTITSGSPIYLQVSSSQNQQWAETFAKQLKDGGFPAKVLDPKSGDDGYRVVVGPYASRADAEAVGKRLGRSYFIIMP